MNKIIKTVIVVISSLNLACNGVNDSEQINVKNSFLEYSENILDYRITPNDSLDKSGLMFSDQGAWFAYSFPKTGTSSIGFSGPFLMTQENGVWSSKSLSRLHLYSEQSGNIIIDFEKDLIHQKSYSSHLEQLFTNENFEIKQELVFISGHTAIQKTRIKNISANRIEIKAQVQGALYDIGISMSIENNAIKLLSEKSSSIGYIQASDNVQNINLSNDNKSYTIHLKSFDIEANETKEIVISQTFIFEEYSLRKELNHIESSGFDMILNLRKKEKTAQLNALSDNRKAQFLDDKYAQVLAKSIVTLQNNWRIPAGELKHEGLFPSYHYEWFNGFWSWDSWKHAVGLSYFNIELAKNQVRAMFDFQRPNGFIVDCIYRDTLIEKHNYRDTKPPLSAWAVSEIYDRDKDLSFIREMYPKIKKYHQWWYIERDHDQDGLCEYGSTDGSLIAAKWESGMDNAIRFDDSKIVKNSDGAYSLDQESVDLNAYLYAEKLYLAKLAEAINEIEDSKQLYEEANSLKFQIQDQFFDENDGWFYDTKLDGKQFIKGKGSEGWTALWAKAASQEQAEQVKNKMMNPQKFFTKVPFQTMSADHPKFDPLNGYWRGPNWLDQSYFGVKGLRNYGFNNEADQATIQILNGASGLLGKGKSIRENYHPITGEGRESQNFSWSAAHVIMLLMEE